MTENPSPWLDRLPIKSRNLACRMLSLLAGVAIAVMVHYLLYRIDLPSKPFIYVAF